MRNEDGKEIWEGYCIDFIQKLSEEMQFDYDLVIPEDLEFGKKLSNGEWSGLIGDLAKGVCLNIFSKYFVYFQNVFHIYHDILFYFNITFNHSLQLIALIFFFLILFYYATL